MPVLVKRIRAPPGPSFAGLGRQQGVRRLGPGVDVVGHRKSEIAVLTAVAFGLTIAARVGRIWYVGRSDAGVRAQEQGGGVFDTAPSRACWSWVLLSPWLAVKACAPW